ncbi:MAG: protein translocase subunit SecF, partial [Candidatus Moranbacteria bacterium]|nr:protein translocase subunit SecF [Candidatus Moranbacteria bacterium]
MKVIKNRKIWYLFSGFLVISSLLALIAFGLNFGIDFTGGSLLRFEIDEKVNLNNDQIQESLSKVKLVKEFENNEGQVETTEDGLGEIVIQRVGEREVVLKLRDINEQTHQEIIERLNQKAAEVLGEGDKEEVKLVKEIKFENIGPSIGRELRERSIIAVAIVLIAIVFYVAYAFRAVSNEFNRYESLRYGVVAIVALMHDVLIVLGVFAVLGRFKGVEINTFFIAALLTILGYSVNDTIIVFDRIRENILKRGHRNFAKTVDKSIGEVVTRSINTSVTTLLVLFSILILGGESTFYLVLALIIGISLGTYSSIFLASPLLV